MLAKGVYVSAAGAVSVEKLWQQPQFRGNVSLQTMLKWCSQDEWTTAREEFQKKAYAGFLNATQDRLLKDHAEVLSQLDPVVKNLIDSLKNEKFEGEKGTDKVRTLVRLLEARSKYTSEAVRLLSPMVSTQPGAGEGLALGPAGDDRQGDADALDAEEQPPEITDEEAFQAAQVIVLARAGRTAATVAANTAPADDGPGADAPSPE